MMNNISVVVGVLNASTFKEQCRPNARYFIRKRALTFPVMVAFLLNRLTKTLQVELDRFLKVLKGQIRKVRVSKQAFSQGRQTLSEKAFSLLNARLVDEC